MHRRVFYFLVVAPVTFVLVSCGPNTTPPLNQKADNSDKVIAEQQKAGFRPLEKPVPPLKLAVPAAQPERIGDTDFKNMDASDLFVFARSTARGRLYKVAAAAQYWGVQKSKTGQYDLACYLAQIGQADPAFYWLQLAAIEEGVDTEHAKRDEDLESLRRDPRWEKVLHYMQDCNMYFESAPISRTVVILPKGYRNTEPIPAVLWLHGLGSRPEDFINEHCQKYADMLNVALIGVSGTKARGPRSFVWAEDVEKDARRLRNALAEVGDRVTVKKGHLITFGFSQGAQVGLEIAVRHPEEYAGSIVLSPGAQYTLDDANLSPLLAQRGFVVSCGANEHPGNVRLAELDADWLRRAKARVIHKAYPGVAAHSFPGDFDERFPEWVKFILNRTYSPVP